MQNNERPDGKKEPITKKSWHFNIGGDVLPKMSPYIDEEMWRKGIKSERVSSSLPLKLSNIRAANITSWNNITSA
jgi:hypothetical protein